MPDQEIENKVKQIIVDELGVDENEVTPNARFIDDLGADSLDTVELVMRFEEEFGIEIPDEDAEKIQSVRDAYNYIDQHKAKGGCRGRGCPRPHSIPVAAGGDEPCLYIFNGEL